MYYRLNSISLNVVRSTEDNFNIVSEVVDAGMSYQNPILVNSTDELDIWFGKNFSSRNYFLELINSGVSLYLYKPISSSIVLNKDDEFIDYSKFRISKSSYEDLALDGKSGKEETIYKSKDGESYIWNDGEFININLLPQNLSEVTKSMSNRDRIYISSVGYEHSYSYPEFNITNGLCVSSTKVAASKDCLIDYGKFKDGIQTFSLNINSLPILGNGFVVFPVMSKSGSKIITTKKLFYKGEIPSTEIVPRKQYSGDPIEISSISDFISYLDEDIYKITKKDLLSYVIESSYLIEDYMYSNKFSSTLTLEPNLKLSNAILSNSVGSSMGVSIWSKTIGIDSDIYDDSKYIKVTIEEGTLDNYYRFIITRYGYEEIIEGTLYPEIGENRLDEKINLESKLIYCKFGDISEGLRTGTFTLMGAEVEEETPEMYRKSLEVMFDIEKETIYPDFILVPDITLFGDSIGLGGYYTILDKFLEISNDLHTQVLIQNFTSDYSIEEVEALPEYPEDDVVYKLDNHYYILKDSILTETTNANFLRSVELGGDFVFNKIEKDNRLLYFLDTIEFKNSYRPAYYVFLNGIFNDKYFADSSSVLHYQPFFNPYIDEDGEDILEKYKCNFLSYNNHLYYYKRYFSGNHPNTTGLMRFVMGKVYREFEKNKWKILGNRTSSAAQNSINLVLNNIKENFSIVRNIIIEKVESNLEKNSLSATINIYVSDLVDNDIKLDITINYSTN